MVTVEQIKAKTRRRWEPPPDLKVSEWSDEFRVLSKESSAEPGKFSMDRTPYFREIVDTVCDPLVAETWVMKGSQVAYSENLNNIVGYFTDQDASSIMMMQPTLQMAEGYSKDRISPMYRDSPVLRQKVDDRSRTSGNTILHKKFAGGYLTLCGANSPASLASRPIRVVLADEVDRYPASAGDEGDPINLAKRRQITFWNAVFFAGGTPTIKGASRTEVGFQSGDQRHYHVPCPHCGELHPLERENLCDDQESEHYGQFQCPHCQAWIEEKHKRDMIKDRKAGGRAEWRASKPFEGIASFHLWAAVSPWMSWKAICDDYHATKSDKEQAKTHVNTILGETFEEAGEKPESEDLMKRREKYEPGGIPDEVEVITAGVDTQGDRLEFQVIGWGAGEESWSLDYDTISGSPLQQRVWDDLDKYLQSAVFTRIDGREMKIKQVLIDSGGKGSKAEGHVSDQVYKFVRGKQYRGIYACKGSSTYGNPVVARVSKLKKPPIRLVMVGTDTAKDLIYSRLELEGSGPGCVHFPLSYERKYFEMLTAEEKVVEMVHGAVKVRWRPARDAAGRERKRNEALDTFVYALTALRMLPINLQAMARKGRNYVLKGKKKAEKADEEREEKREEPQEKEEKKTPKARKAGFRRGRRGGGWSTKAY